MKKENKRKEGELLQVASNLKEDDNADKKKI
jgi:hypothetical protein